MCCSPCACRIRPRLSTASTASQEAFLEGHVGIGTAVAEAGLTVRYTTTSALVNELAEGDAARRLSSVIARHSKVDLLCLDEFGYLDLDKKGAHLLFQIRTALEKCKATAVATNSPFAEWDKTFADPRQVGHNVEAAPTHHLADACLYCEACGVRGHQDLHIN